MLGIRFFFFLFFSFFTRSTFSRVNDIVIYWWPVKTLNLDSRQSTAVMFSMKHYVAGRSKSSIIFFLFFSVFLSVFTWIFIDFFVKYCNTKINTFFYFLLVNLRARVRCQNEYIISKSPARVYCNINPNSKRIIWWLFNSLCDFNFSVIFNEHYYGQTLCLRWRHTVT